MKLIRKARYVRRMQWGKRMGIIAAEIMKVENLKATR